MATKPQTTEARPELARDLRLSHATAVVVGTVIGSGIFLVPAEMMQAVGSAKLVYLAWFVGGLLSFFGALTYAELGAMKPQAGGEYVYVRDGYGPLAGFLYAWTWFLIAKPASIATLATGFVRVLGNFSALSFLSRNLISVPFHVTYGQLLAIAAGVATVGILYMLVNAAVQYVLPASMVATSQRPASDATAAVLGSVGAGIVSVGMAVSMLVAMNGTIMSGARIPFAVARDRYFFSALAEVHPRFHTPSIAIIAQAVLAIILLLFGGSFRQFFSLAIFAEWLFYMVAASTVFLFRRREPAAPRPYRVWGYPVVPSQFVLAAAVLLYYTFRDNWPNSGYGSLVILAGIPVFYLFARKRRA